ncbi:unnamed protein product, partial [Staurois parvus]
TSTTLENPRNGLVGLNTKTLTTLESPGDGLVGLNTKTLTTLESPGDSSVGLDTEKFTTLESPGNGLLSPDNGTSFILSLSGSHVVNNADFIKTEDPTNPNEETSGPVLVLCNPTDVFTIRSGGQALTGTPPSETDFLTVIQMEDLHARSKGELSTIQAELWDVHSGCSNVLLNRNMEAHQQQSEAVFPVALVIPHNTIIPQNSWIGDHGTLLVDTPQWCRQFQVADCQQVDGKGYGSAPPAEWTKQDDLGAPLL